MQVWIGLVLAFISALAVNWAYTREHDAAAGLPTLSPSRPLRSAKVLLRNRRWLVGFGTETAGWLVYVASLRLAPIAVVQAVSASGIAVLAFVTSRGDPRRLTRREKFAVVVALAGLVLLALSLVGTPPSDRKPNAAAAAVWLAACLFGASFLILAHTRFARAFSLGLATGLLFAAGDICAKLVGYGETWLLAAVPLVFCYGIGTSVLQSAFQHGNALTAAGTATMTTNALPIAAGFVLFHEALPHGFRAFLQVAAFAALVLSATALGRPEAMVEEPEASPDAQAVARGKPAPETA
jgi:hypothetical protein